MNFWKRLKLAFSAFFFTLTHANDPPKNDFTNAHELGCDLDGDIFYYRSSKGLTSTMINFTDIMRNHRIDVFEPVGKYDFIAGHSYGKTDYSKE